MSWVKQCKLPAVEAIRYQGLSCNSLPDLWHALHLSYNAAANRSVELSILDDVFFFFFQKFITWCSIAVCGRLSTTSSLHGPQGPECPITGKRHYQYQRRNLT